MVKKLSKLLIISMLLIVMIVPAFAEDKVMDDATAKITITNIVGQAKETISMYGESKEYDVYLVTKGAKITIESKTGIRCGIMGLMDEGDGSYYEDPWPWGGTGEFRMYIDGGMTGYNELEGCTYYSFFYEKDGKDVNMMFKLVEEGTKDKEFTQPNFNTNEFDLAISNIVGETTKSVTIDDDTREYKVYLVNKESRATLTAKSDTYAGGGVVREEDGYVYSDPCLQWVFADGTTDYTLIKANKTAHMDFKGSNVNMYYFSAGRDSEHFIIKVEGSEEKTEEKAAGDLNHELYDLSITNFDRVVKETLKLEGEEAKEYDVYVANNSSVLSFTPKKTLTAGVMSINLEEEYMSPKVWIINGSQELVNFVDKDVTATCNLSKPGYYHFGTYDDQDNEIVVIIKVEGEVNTKPNQPTEPTPVEYDENDTPNNWAKGDVTAAIENELIPTELQSNYVEDITRKEFCQAVIQLLETKTGKTAEQILAEVGSRSDDDNPFTDASEDYIIAAYQLKIIGGRGNKIFDPNGTIIRQEAAAILTNVARILGADTSGTGREFADVESIKNYAKASVDYVSSTGIMGDMGNNNFGPNSTYTRQQSYITLLRLFNTLK